MEWAPGEFIEEVFAKDSSTFLIGTSVDIRTQWAIEEVGYKMICARTIRCLNIYFSVNKIFNQLPKYKSI